MADLKQQTGTETQWGFLLIAGRREEKKMKDDSVLAGPARGNNVILRA